MYKKAHLISDFRKKISPRLGLEPTKMRQKVSLCLIEFSERERKIKLALLNFSDRIITAGHCFIDRSTKKPMTKSKIQSFKIQVGTDTPFEPQGQLFKFFHPFSFHLLLCELSFG